MVPDESGNDTVTLSDKDFELFKVAKANAAMLAQLATGFYLECVDGGLPEELAENLTLLWLDAQIGAAAGE